MKGNELKPRIGFFGRRNSGKSSLVNMLTGQSVSIVSSIPGSTTDPVRKSMEISGIGPVVIIDTAGIDDVGALGRQRVEKTVEVVRQVDLAFVLIGNDILGQQEQFVVDLCRKTNTPCIPVCSKNDTFTPDEQLVKTITSMFGVQPLSISTSDSSSTARIIAAILEHLPETAYRHDSLLGDVINRGDTVVLVCPIDSSAPEGRLILPQVQVLRDVLDNDASAVVCKDAQLQQQLSSMAVPPRLVVTDSQVFGNVSAIVPASVPLTSFSVVLARAKGMFVEYLQGTKTIANLKDGDKVLLLESCTHNITCEDIGRVKIPKLLSSFTGKKLSFDVVAGLGSLAAPITDYSLVIQCGGCVVSPKQLASRLLPAIEAGVPVSNYGLTLAYVNGIFDRAIQIFQQKQTT